MSAYNCRQITLKCPEKLIPVNIGKGYREKITMDACISYEVHDLWKKGMFNFADYILNTNLQVTIKEYEDHDTDDQIKKAIMLVDGKPVDLGSLVVMQVKNV